MGFELAATKGTAAAISAAGVPCAAVNKVAEGRPHVVDMLKNREVALVINTVEENVMRSQIRVRSVWQHWVLGATTITTIAGAEAAVEGMRHLNELHVYDLQGLHKSLH